MTTIFVLADTHNKLPLIIYEMARGADEIWHLGDVCDEWVLEELQFIGPPVTVVRGNCDDNYKWLLACNLTRNGVRFRLEHICPPPPRAPADYDVLLHGHTHVPRDETIGGVRFLNPGCVTRPNRGAPPSIGWLAITEDGKVNWRLELLR
jgi:putative phosphoesterase